MRIRKGSAILLKALAFLLPLCMLFSYIQDLSIIRRGNYNFQLQAGFFNEPKDSLDVVYIGASPTFSSWITPIVYKKYGITSWTFANNSQPFIVVQELLEMAYKRQPNAVFMICVNGLYPTSELLVHSLHGTTDYLGPSFEKLKLTNKLCRYFNSTPEEYLELLFPIVRYHSNWNDLSAHAFHRLFDPYKGADYYPEFFEAVDISQNKVTTNELAPLPSFTEEALNELLDYCAGKNIKAVFVLSAQYRDEQTMQWYNTLIDRIEDRDFPVINELADFDTIGLDDTTDFYNALHTNIHGALKITDYLSQYLLDHYDFPEKSGGGYESWDIAYEKYKEVIAPYLTEEELEQLP